MNLTNKNVKCLAAIIALSLVPLSFLRGQTHTAADLATNVTADVPGAILTDSTLLRFRLGKVYVDSLYAGNSRTLHYLHSVLGDSLLRRHVDSLHIYAFASPEGSVADNGRIALRRSLAVKNYLVGLYPQLDAARIRPFPLGEDWTGLRRLAAADTLLPNREEVLQIIDRISDPDRREALLKKLNAGIPYRYMSRHLLPLLRNASVHLIRTALPGLPLQPPPGAHPSMSCETAYKAPAAVPFMGVPDVRPALRQPLFALKTNLLFDLALAPNIEVEVPIGRRWSVTGDVIFPWWLFEGDEYCYEILYGGAEGRYWLGNRQRRRPLTGYFVGFYAGGGKYDLQWDVDG